MIAAGDYYPYSANPKDIRAAQLANQENFFFIDVQSRGKYPNWTKHKFAEEGIEIGRDGERELLLNLIRKMAENGETEEIPRLSVDEHFLKMKMEQYEMN